MHSFALAAVMAFAVAAPAAVAAPIPPAPTTWVTDTAGFMTPAARDALDTRLQAYERATGHQVVVWIGPTIGDAALDDWAVRTFAAWRLGRAGQDDGIAMFVLADDRKVDIEVGYGLEGEVPDAVAHRIIQEVMAPKLRAGQRDAAVTDGANAVLAAIEGKPWVDDGTVAAPAQAQSTPVFTYILGGLALIAFLILMITHPQAAMMLLWSISSSRGGGSIGGGGFGGGGGFSGGGGRSGGGGARGGW